jgi:hypothetical protein
VFLNPFPYGAGITSSDALSVCLPIVLLHDSTHNDSNPTITSSTKTSSTTTNETILLDDLYRPGIHVLQFALAQVRSLGSDGYYLPLFSASNIDDYVSKAVYIASLDAPQRIELRRRMCADKIQLFGTQHLDAVMEDWMKLFRTLRTQLLT